MSSGANVQAKVLQFAPFHDHGLGHVAMYPSWPHVLVAKLFQPFQNGVILTVKELCEIFSRTIRALAYDLYQLIHNWCIAGLVLQLLKPSVNFYLANSLIRKMWNRFLERLIMLNNGFYKRRRWVRHIGSPCKLIDYLKTVEFYTLKTLQSKKGKNSDSKKYTISIQHVSFNIHYFLTISGPT